MKSLRENLRAALSVMTESNARKEATRRVHGVRPSRLVHQHEHTLTYRRNKLRGFVDDLNMLEETGDEALYERLQRGLKKCHAERTKNPDKMAEWLLYVDELESRGRTDLLP